MKYILTNRKSKNASSQEVINEVINKYCQEDYKEISVIGLNYAEFFKDLNKDDEITLVGGDGTLQHFADDVVDVEFPCNIYYYPNGTGNDFFNDMEEKAENGRILINEYMHNLPIVTVNGKDYRFVNGVGYGIDGYCCEEGDLLQAKSDKPINYTSIAIKGLLFKFKPRNAVVTVDGVAKTYKKCWLAPTMKGRCYGGGMHIAPAQDRSNPEGLVTNVVMSGKGKLPTLICFPKIFSGEHVKNKMIDIRTGKNIKVEFDRPTALQIDGETIPGVTSYEVRIK